MRRAHPKRPAKPIATPVAAPPPAASPPIKPLVLRPAAAARALQCSERTIWTLIGKGVLRVSRVNSLTLVHMSSIEELLFTSAHKPAGRGAARRTRDDLPLATTPQ